MQGQSLDAVRSKPRYTEEHVSSLRELNSRLESLANTARTLGDRFLGVRPMDPSKAKEAPSPDNFVGVSSELLSRTSSLIDRLQEELHRLDDL